MPVSYSETETTPVSSSNWFAVTDPNCGPFTTFAMQNIEFKALGGADFDWMTEPVEHSHLIFDLDL
jgi:hypothetical protein